MKRMWVGAFFLVFLLAVGIVLLLLTQNFHREFSDTMEHAAAAAMAGRWEEAAQKAEKGRAQWDSHKEFLASFTDHAPVEEAASLFSQLEIYQKQGYAADFAAICRELSHLSEAIAEAHGIRWWSIL